MIRMLAPAKFASVKEFEDALSQLKTVMGRIPAPRTEVKEKGAPVVKAAYVPRHQGRRPRHQGHHRRAARFQKRILRQQPVPHQNGQRLDGHRG